MKTKNHMNVKVTYSLPALWKATPSFRKVELLESMAPHLLFIPVAVFLLLIFKIPIEITVFTLLFLIFFTFVFYLADTGIGIRETTLPVLEGSITHPDSLTRSKYMAAEWKEDIIQLYIEDNHGNKNELPIEDFLSSFHGKYKLFFREEGIMGKAEVLIKSSQIKDLKSQLTPLQIDIEIQKDGTVGIYLEQRETRWYDKIEEHNR